jgi:hypothetical protein
MTRRLIRIVAGVTLGVFGTLAALEGALRLLPVQDGIYAADANDEWPVHHLTPGRPFTWSSQWHMAERTTGHINNLGYVAPFDYQPGARTIAVLGDSYVESLMNPYEATLQAHAQALVGDGAAVYNFGISGSALPDYLGLASSVTKRFRVEAMIVVVSEGDFAEGFVPQPGHFNWTSGDAQEPVALRADVRRSAGTKAMRELALFRYVRGNLKVTPSALFKSRPSHGPVATGCQDAQLLPGDEALVGAFVRRLPDAYGIAPEAVALVVDSESSRRALYDRSGRQAASSPCATRDSLALDLLAKQAERAGFNVVRLAPVFDAHYRSTGERVDHSPDDWHWNAVGHRLAAAQAIDALAAAGKVVVTRGEGTDGARRSSGDPLRSRGDRAALN